MRNQRSARVVGAAIGIAIGAGTAAAAIVSVMGQAVKQKPASVVLDVTQSNTKILAFDEKQCFVLQNDLEVDEGIIAAGTKVSCELNHADPFGSKVFTGKVKYDRPILGVISTSTALDNSDDDCMDGMVTYPVPGTELNRGLDSSADSYTVVGKTIDLHLDVPSWSDQVRVILTCL